MCGHTSLLVDLHLGVQIYADNDEVADDVERAHAVQDVRVVEGHFFAHLHHHQDDDQVGTWGLGQLRSFDRVLPVWGALHLRIHDGRLIQ